MARSLFASSGALTTTIGLGTSFDEETMLAIAREGSGSYHFVRRPADISDILRDELDERAQSVAQGLRVRVVLAPGVGLRRVYGSRLLDEAEHAAVRATEVAVDRRVAAELGIARDRQQESDEGLRMHIPTFRRGDQHVILMELDVPPGQAGSLARVGRVSLDYKDLLLETNGHGEIEVSAPREADREAVAASVRRPVKRNVLAFQAGEALQDAAGCLARGDARRAGALLAERRHLLETAAAVWRDPLMRRDASLLGRYETVVARAWGGFGGEEQRALVLAMNYYGDRRMR
jgi:Ca-activated chloride channel family protein